MDHPNCKNPLTSDNSECSNCCYSNNKCSWITISKVYPPNDIIIKGLLESYGIPVRISRTEIPQLPVTIGPLGEVEIAVPETMVEKARDLLKNTTDSSK